MENWATVPEVLAKHARHVTNGEPIPAALIERIRRRRLSTRGSRRLLIHVGSDRYGVASAERSAGIDIARLRRDERERIGVPREVACATVAALWPYL